MQPEFIWLKGGQLSLTHIKTPMVTGYGLAVIFGRGDPKTREKTSDKVLSLMNFNFLPRNMVLCDVSTLVK